MPRGQKAALAVVPNPKGTLVIDNKLNFDALENGERTTIQQFHEQIVQGMHDFKNSILKIGEGLAGIEAILEPRRAFTAYLNTVGFPRSSAYRYIRAFKVAKAHLPEMILTQVLATGIQMVGDEKQPFGRYTKAVKKVKLPHGILTVDRAQSWVKTVQQKYREQQKAGRIKTPEQLHTRAVRAVLQALHRVPPETQTGWLKAVIDDVQRQVQVAPPLAKAAGA